MTRLERIKQQLNTLAPLHLQVDNESDDHGGTPGGESHYKVVVVAECFSEQSELQRHRAVYQKLNDEFQSGLHALALHTYSPQEWDGASQEKHASPPCAHAPAK